MTIAQQMTAPTDHCHGKLAAMSMVSGISFMASFRGRGVRRCSLLRLRSVGDETSGRADMCARNPETSQLAIRIAR